MPQDEERLARREAGGREPADEQAQVQEWREELAEAVDRLDEAGGRGVDLADRIDRLQAAVDLFDHPDQAPTCPRCGQPGQFLWPSHYMAVAREILDGRWRCSRCQEREAVQPNPQDEERLARRGRAMLPAPANDPPDPEPWTSCPCDMCDVALQVLRDRDAHLSLSSRHWRDEMAAAVGRELDRLQMDAGPMRDWRTETWQRLAAVGNRAENDEGDPRPLARELIRAHSGRANPQDEERLARRTAGPSPDEPPQVAGWRAALATYGANRRAGGGDRDMTALMIASLEAAVALFDDPEAGPRCPWCGVNGPPVDPQERLRLAIALASGRARCSDCAQASRNPQDEERLARRSGSKLQPGDMPGKFVRVEWDPYFWGGDYDDVGDFAYLEMVGGLSHDNIERRFEELLAADGADRRNIIHYTMDELYVRDHDGDFVEWDGCDEEGPQPNPQDEERLARRGRGKPTGPSRALAILLIEELRRAYEEGDDEPTLGDLQNSLSHGQYADALLHDPDDETMLQNELEELVARVGEDARLDGLGQALMGLTCICGRPFDVQGPGEWVDQANHVDRRLDADHVPQLDLDASLAASLAGPETNPQDEERLARRTTHDPADRLVAVSWAWDGRDTGWGDLTSLAIGVAAGWKASAVAHQRMKGATTLTWPEDPPSFLRENEASYVVRDLWPGGRVWLVFATTTREPPGDQETIWFHMDLMTTDIEAARRRRDALAARPDAGPVRHGAVMRGPFDVATGVDLEDQSTGRARPNPQDEERLARRSPDAPLRCPGCDQEIVVTDGSAGAVPAFYSECGGEGEGICAEAGYAYDVRGGGATWAFSRWELEHAPPSRDLCDQIVMAHDKVLRERRLRARRNPQDEERLSQREDRPGEAPQRDAFEEARDFLLRVLTMVPGWAPDRRREWFRHGGYVVHAESGAVLFFRVTQAGSHSAPKWRGEVRDSIPSALQAAMDAVGLRASQDGVSVSFSLDRPAATLARDVQRRAADPWIAQHRALVARVQEATMASGASHALAQELATLFQANLRGGEGGDDWTMWVSRHQPGGTTFHHTAEIKVSNQGESVEFKVSTDHASARALAQALAGILGPRDRE